MTQNKEKWRPPFTSGVLQEDYSLLQEYLSLAKEKAPGIFEKALLGEKDYELLKQEALASDNALELLEKLSSILEDRVDPRLAEEAARKVGLPLKGRDAVRAVARLLAAWLIEAGDYWGMIKLRRTST